MRMEWQLQEICTQSVVSDISPETSKERLPDSHPLEDMALSCETFQCDLHIVGSDSGKLPTLEPGNIGATTNFGPLSSAKVGCESSEQPGEL